MRRARFFLGAFLLWLASVLGVQARSIPQPTTNFYVLDEAQVLSASTEAELVRQGASWQRIDGTQVVVVTIKSLEGDSLEEFANKLFREWGIGDKQKNNG
ncbi:TPM domain-containing protein, partial [bacterium]|nr:TPM domain-containing protein [bacterium]